MPVMPEQMLRERDSSTTKLKLGTEILDSWARIRVLGFTIAKRPAYDNRI